MLDQSKIKYSKPDLEKINSDQVICCDKKEAKKFGLSFFYNIFNKSFKFKFEWRF